MTSRKDDLVILTAGIDKQTAQVMGVLSRALTVFGADSDTVAPPRFAADRRLEDDLGRGHF